MIILCTISFLIVRKRPIYQSDHRRLCNKPMPDKYFAFGKNFLRMELTQSFHWVVGEHIGNYNNLALAKR